MKRSLSVISILLLLCSCSEALEQHNESTLSNQSADTTRPIADSTHAVVVQGSDTPVIPTARQTDTITRVRPRGKAIIHGTPNMHQRDSVVKVKTDGKFKKK